MSRVIVQVGGVFTTLNYSIGCYGSMSKRLKMLCCFQEKVRKNAGIFFLSIINSTLVMEDTIEFEVVLA